MNDSTFTHTPFVVLLVQAFLRWRAVNAEDLLQDSGSQQSFKQALAEAQAAQYEQDERGRLTKKLDPTKELQKKMRLLEEEQQKMQADRDSELAAVSLLALELEPWPIGLPP